MIKQKIKRHPVSLLVLFQSLLAGAKGLGGLWFLGLTLASLSFVAGVNFDSAPRYYKAGQIADMEISTPRELYVVDQEETQNRKKVAQTNAPSVYDYSYDQYTKFHTRLLELFKILDASNQNFTDAEFQSALQAIDPQISVDILHALAKPEIQNYIIKNLLPRIESQAKEGLVGNLSLARVGNAGFFIKDIEDKTVMERPYKRNLMDAETFRQELSSQIPRNLSWADRNAILSLLKAWMPITLTLNQDETHKKGNEAMDAISPVEYKVYPGEVIVHKGDRITREQQLKLKELYSFSSTPVQWNIVGGAFIFSLIFSMGFFLSPSGKPGSQLHTKDIYLISVSLLFFGFAAKGAYLFGLKMNSAHIVTALAMAFPVAGATGLIAMVFSARRYCTTALLLSFFTILMFRENYAVFLYYFLGGMLATWLVVKAQSRQDVVWSIVPLALGLMIFGTALLFLKNFPFSTWPYQYIAILCAAILSLILLFTISPVLEMIFGYSTRFRLMELMSLEQPLMQEIMVTIPGTYHHSLVVANMVEAGAKAIGANSLLCKVAALYHDAGKLSYPDYFIENQFGAPNKHDRLSPSMSALILLSHVKKGTEFAEKYKLGKEISDIIRQHHGTRMMRYFYQKAINMGEKPQEAEYSYPGPKPQSKEAAILMLADSVEASSRTLTDPTPARIKSHIDSIIKGIFSEGQLDESELTFKDLHYLSENFQRILTGIFHQRIVYPETKLKSDHAKPQQKNNDVSIPAS